MDAHVLPATPTAADAGAGAPQPSSTDRRPSPLSFDSFRRFFSVAGPYWGPGAQRRAAWGFLVGLFVLMALETQLAVLLNHQTGEVASALAARNGDRFWLAIQYTLAVLVFAVPAHAAYYYLRDVYANHWRRWLTGRFLDGYLQDRTYFRISCEGQLDNPDQRISEDINTFTGRSLHFLLIFVGAAMQLVAFSAVLWTISPQLMGVMAVYAVAGTALSMRLFGEPLIRLNFWQTRREADFRFKLMRVRENAESIAFYRGEPQERCDLNARFDAVYDNYGRLIKTQMWLNVFQRGFTQLATLIPNVVLAGAVLGGQLELGKAVAAGGAFLAVLSAVTLIVDNFESLSRFIAGIERLQGLAEAVFDDGSRADGSRIERAQGETLSVSNLTVQTPGSAHKLVQGLNLDLPPGESLLITGASGTGKSSILRAIAGLWRSGKGQVQHPPTRDVFFLPQKPYLQNGTLRSQLIYPSSETGHSDEALLQILRDVQLPELAERYGGLDAVKDWDKLLSGGEQQRLAFARVLVHEPRMAILDEATSALDSANEATLYQRLRDRGTTLISIAHRAAVERFHTRVLRLKGGGKWELRKARDPERDAAREPTVESDHLTPSQPSAPPAV